MQLPVVLHTDNGTRYGVTVPDLPGCYSAGDGLEDALASIKEAIELHLEGIIDEGGEIPCNHSLTEHQSNAEYANGIWALVDVDLSRLQGKTERINITIPRRVLDKIDNYTKAHGATRSGFLVEAALKAMRN
ncbi:MAG TPA: type II toxin-antitoxin system HicB family antitoxin [Xylella sp.]